MREFSREERYRLLSPAQGKNNFTPLNGQKPSWTGDVIFIPLEVLTTSSGNMYLSGIRKRPKDDDEGIINCHVDDQAWAIR
ncbi:hypothetical protein CEXT_393761 [Caerostris extrusa]|uniref:Uncharacterized protein n=1 Tax=Caerostris extrusa TaxID=172846 RepID=A0AAV4MJW3_CAEEX|nr:hypothetical protein CEXT_393761 [Caerostris extrusa]